jgi:predicted RNase H-like nuclease
MNVAGADVWKGRWVLVVLIDGRYAATHVAQSMEEVVARVPDADAFGVDIPIGLPPPGMKPRAADLDARRYVGPRWASVFMTPCREVLEQHSYNEANAVATALGCKRISRQTFGLARAILDVDPVAKAEQRIHEVHPEVSFVTANQMQHLPWSKTSWSGMKERVRILATHGIELPEDLGVADAVGIPDVLDAAIVAWSADRIANGIAVRLPSDGERIGGIWA